MQIQSVFTPVLFTTDEILNLIKGQEWRSGVEAYYFSLGDGWGLKLFSNEKDRDRVYDAQELLHSVRLAPEIMDKVDIFIPLGHVKWQWFGDAVYYGFITEEIPHVWKDIVDKLEDDSSTSKEWDVKASQLESSVNNYIYADDVHSNNIGRNHMGEWVVIDTGHMGDYDDD